MRHAIAASETLTCFQFYFKMKAQVDLDSSVCVRTKTRFSCDKCSFVFFSNATGGVWPMEELHRSRLWADKPWPPKPFSVVTPLILHCRLFSNTAVIRAEIYRLFMQIFTCLSFISVSFCPSRFVKLNRCLFVSLVISFLNLFSGIHSGLLENQLVEGWLGHTVLTRYSLKVTCLFKKHSLRDSWDSWSLSYFFEEAWKRELFVRLCVFVVCLAWIRSFKIIWFDFLCWLISERQYLLKPAFKLRLCWMYWLFKCHCKNYSFDSLGFICRLYGLKPGLTVN